MHFTHDIRATKFRATKHFLYSPQRMLSDIKNREVIIKDIKSYIYQYFKWSRDN